MKLHGRLRTAEALSKRENTGDASREAVERVLAGIGASPDLATVFFTPHHADQADRILEDVGGILGADVIVGCSAMGVIGGGEELKSQPGLAVWAARLPGARVQAFTLEYEERGEQGGLVKGWPDAGPEAGAVMLVDPFSFPLEPFLSSLRKTERSPQLIGGVASGAVRQGGNRLLTKDEIRNGGAVGFVMDGAVRLQPILAQGCRGIGRRFEVTHSEGNQIFELSGAPASQVLSQLLNELEDQERDRFRRAPQLGVLVGGPQGDAGGAYQMRGLINVDAQLGCITVDRSVPAGDKVQFHARDSKAASAEMDSLLGMSSSLIPDAAGALLFSCNGRGEALFGRPNHDVEALRRFYPDLPVSGLFAAGEVGPICGQPFLHGFTASIGLLVPGPE